MRFLTLIPILALVVVLLPLASAEPSYDLIFTDVTDDADQYGSPSSGARLMGDIVQCGSTDQGETFKLWVKMYGDIRSDVSLSVTWQIDINADKQGDFVVTYSANQDLVTCRFIYNSNRTTHDLVYKVLSKTVEATVEKVWLGTHSSFDITVGTTTTEGLDDSVVDSCHPLGTSDTPLLPEEGVTDESPGPWLLLGVLAVPAVTSILKRRR